MRKDDVRMVYVWRQIPSPQRVMGLLALLMTLAAQIVGGSMIPMMISAGGILFGGEDLLSSPTDMALIQSRTALTQALSMLGWACAWPILMYSMRLRPRRFLVRTTLLPL